MKPLNIRPVAADDKPWVTGLMKKWWAGPAIITHGKTHYADLLPGFIAEYKRKKAGLITYYIDGHDCEIVTMNSLVENKGLGTAMVTAVKEASKTAGCKRIWLITTNNNTRALRFWQKQGFVINVVRVNVMEEYRKLKPEIPLEDENGIPIRDEIELEMLL